MAGLQKVEVASIYGAKTQRGLVEITVTDDNSRVKLQLELSKAREIRDNIAGAIEAAMSDELIVRFLRDKIGLPNEAAMRALLDFRELRQGSRETVYPT